MATILYGVAGEGMGHATRSRVIIEALAKKHKVIIVSSRKPFHYFSQHFEDVHDIQGFYLVYRRNKVTNIGTLIKNFAKLPKGSIRTLNKLTKLVKKHRPDIVISDFEPFTFFISRFFRIPLININNMAILTRCKIKVKKRHLKDSLQAKIIIRSLNPTADYHLILTFFFPKIKAKNTKLFSPILRKEILKSRPSIKDHILVYQTSDTYKKLLPELKKIKQQFIIYGHDKDKIEKNIIFKTFNEDVFIKELASAKAVITNGGFSLIGEALHLKKPILSVPVRNQFEQILNAIQVQKLGYGEHHRKLTKRIIMQFIKNIDLYRKKLKDYDSGAQGALIKEVERLIKQVVSKKKGKK